MDKLMSGRTTFVIAHRLSTVRNADCIMVLEQGQIIERGTHDQLMEQKGKYYSCIPEIRFPHSRKNGKSKSRTTENKNLSVRDFLRSSGWFYVRVAKRIANIRFEMMIASDTVVPTGFWVLKKTAGFYKIEEAFEYMQRRKTMEYLNQRRSCSILSCGAKARFMW